MNLQTSNHIFNQRKMGYRKLIWVSILFDYISMPLPGIDTFRYLITIPIFGIDTSFDTKVSIPVSIPGIDT